jgi:Protein of unknown function (DUF3072)
MPAHDLPTNTSGLDPEQGPASVNDPVHWTPGSEPMTTAQASRLKGLSEDARELDAFKPKLTRAEAARRIDALEAKLRLQDGPPHTL